MAKKTKVTLNRSEDLADIDEELDAAMQRLSDTNERVGEALESFAPEEAAAAEGGASGEALRVGETKESAEGTGKGPEQRDGADGEEGKEEAGESD